jgi:hypothetical protein
MRHIRNSITPISLFAAIALCGWSVTGAAPALGAQASGAKPASGDSAPDWTRSPIRDFERAFERARRMQDALDVRIANSSGRDTVPWDIPREVRERELRAVTDSLRAARPAARLAARSDADRAALAAMSAIIDKEFPGPIADASTRGAGRRTPPECAYDAEQLLADSGVRGLRGRIKTCYRLATEAVRVGDSTFNRLGVLGRLGWEPDRDRRRALWVALDTVWRSVNGGDARADAWRTLIRAESRSWGAGKRPLDRSATALGIPAREIEQAMEALLDAWRRATPDSLIDPWDYWYQNGEASRRLASRIPRAKLLGLNDAYYKALGADLASFHTHYDIEPRPGQTPVAYTAFGDRPRWENGAWVSAEPWIFATYADGGLDILNELLHESGHGVHIAAIRTRPAYADWPDANVFTEGIADIVALDVYEPAWQQRWLGDSVPTSVSLRARYGSIMLDAAWSLFEIRMHRTPDADPNAVWTDITRKYLHIAPHPERSWWAMRAQLFDLPGYMLNYAMGAIVVADVRATLMAKHGSWLAGDPQWYPRAAQQLYRFGREVPARVVLERVLGRRPSAKALTADLARMRPTAQTSRR